MSLPLQSLRTALDSGIWRLRSSIRASLPVPRAIAIAAADGIEPSPPPPPPPPRRFWIIVVSIAAAVYTARLVDLIALSWTWVLAHPTSPPPPPARLLAPRSLALATMNATFTMGCTGSACAEATALAIISAVSDGLIALAYFAIPCQIFYFQRHLQIEGLRGQYKAIVWLFESFILLCGMTHLIKMWAVDPGYLLTTFKILTAIVSVLTALILVRLMPAALTLPARLFVLEEELGLRIQNEQQLQLENSNLHKLRSVTQSIRRSMQFQAICDIASVQLANHFDLTACFVFAIDAAHPADAHCLADYSRVAFRRAPTRGAQINMAPLLVHHAVVDPATGASAGAAMGSGAAAAGKSPLMQAFSATEMTAAGPTVAGAAHAHWVRLQSPLLADVFGIDDPGVTGTLLQVYDGTTAASPIAAPIATASGSVHGNASWTTDGRRVMMLLVHSRETMVQHGPVLSDAIGQIEIALDQSAQIEREAARRSQVTVLEREKKEAEALNGMKTVFLATISHELRTPMNAIIGFVDLLLSQYELTRDMRDILEIVAVSSNTLLNLVNDILDLSKLEFHGAQFTMEEAPLSITDVAEQSVEVVYSAADKKGIAVYAVLDHAVDAVLGDKLRLRQILVNLLSNAIKFTSAGSVTLTVTTAEPASYYITPDGAKQRKQRVLDYYNPALAADRKLVRVFFQLRDSGIGIEQDKIHLLFEKFQQLDATIARRFQGTGLGLAITSRLVELHHGRIIVDSVPGIGALFTVMLLFPAAPDGSATLLDAPLGSPSAGPAPVSEEYTPTNNVAIAFEGTRVGVLSGSSTERTALLAILRRCRFLPTGLDAVPPLNLALLSPSADLGFDALVVDEDTARGLAADDAARLAHWQQRVPVVVLMRIKSGSRLAAAGDTLARHTVTKPVKTRNLDEMLRTALLEYYQARFAGQQQYQQQLAQFNQAGGTGVAPSVAPLLVSPLELQSKAASGSLSRSSVTPAADEAHRDRLANLKVLVVDDNAINQMVAARTLRSMGVDNVETANNGAEAVAYVEARPGVSIVFMDVSMPVMDGLDATRAILARASTPRPGAPRGATHGDGLPFICAMTASALPEERYTCLSTGMHDFVPKPTRRQDLLSLLDRYFAWRAEQMAAGTGAGPPVAAGVGARGPAGPAGQLRP
ncbi:Histidine kinase osmosensor [Blastocladiella emersonii ATCC 22665]|nr:Histidine kinase osmosensor [Blastocladiella emersonii ATCC 22665]